MPQLFQQTCERIYLFRLQSSGSFSGSNSTLAELKAGSLTKILETANAHGSSVSVSSLNGKNVPISFSEAFAMLLSCYTVHTWPMPACSLEEFLSEMHQRQLHIQSLWPKCHWYYFALSIITIYCKVLSMSSYWIQWLESFVNSCQW